METEEKFGKANLLDDSPPNVVPCGRAPLPLHLGSRVKLNVAWLHKQLLVPLLHLINKDKVYLFTNPGCSGCIVLHRRHINCRKCVPV